MVYHHKWYAVIIGSEPGVYPTWIEAGPKTRNIPGGPVFQSFPTKEQAIHAFEAAKARGEVKAYPDAGKEDKPTGKSKSALLSPLGEEASLLRVPLDLEDDVESTRLQTPLPLSARSRVAKLRRALRDSPAPEPLTTFSSPPTHVTRVNPPLCYEDDSPPVSPVARPTSHFMFTSSGTSSSSRVYPDADGRFSEMDIPEMPQQLEVEDWASTPPTSSSSDSHSGAEEHTSRLSRCMPLHLDPPSRNIGVEYRSIADLADMERADPRIWLPKSRVFDPDKIKPRPWTRPPSPVKGGVSPISSYETVSSGPQFPRQSPSMHSPFVRTGRGRLLKLVPSPSLPILPDWESEDKYSRCSPSPTQPLDNDRMGKGIEKERSHSVRDEHLVEEPIAYGLSPGNRSHVQLVPRNDRDEQSAIVVHCPPNCPHETCYHSSLALSVSGIQPSRSTAPRYVDARVSPIVTISGRMIQGTNSPVKIRSKQQPDLDDDHPYGLPGSAHVSHQRVALESDVRSPIARGTMVPRNTAE